MTAEIAVMNREAVALAADSAVSGAKVFTSANKIFALSMYQPVAVMVYDSAQFLNVPWETIIKTYRAELGSRSFATLREQAGHFLGFFDRANPLFRAAAQKEGNEALFRAFFRAMLDHVDGLLEERSSLGEELTEDDIAEQTADVIAGTFESWWGPLRCRRCLRANSRPSSRRTRARLRMPSARSRTSPCPRSPGSSYAR